MKEIACEYGSSQPVRFLFSSSASEEVKRPKYAFIDPRSYTLPLKLLDRLESPLNGLPIDCGAMFVYRPPCYTPGLSQNAKLGVKFAHTARILNDAWLVNLMNSSASFLCYNWYWPKSNYTMLDSLDYSRRLVA